MGEHQVHLIQGAPLIQVHHGVSDLFGPFQGGILGRIHKLRVNGNVLLLKEVPSHLADQEQGGVLFPGQIGFCQPQHIVVIGTGQAFVAGDHDKPGLAILLGDLVPLNEPVLQIRGVAEDIQHGFGQLVKVGLHIGKLLPGLLHLGRGDQVHGVGDLQRLLDALHPGADFGYACHVALTCFL